jgi:hypothetical protein
MNRNTVPWLLFGVSRAPLEVTAAARSLQFKFPQFKSSSKLGVLEVGTARGGSSALLVLTEYR